MLVLFILYLLVTLSLLTFTSQYADKSYSGMIKLLWYLQQTFIVSLALTYDSHCLYRSTQALNQPNHDNALKILIIHKGILSFLELDAPLLPIKQADMCLVCIAFASWVLKSVNPQGADTWKAGNWSCKYNSHYNLFFIHPIIQCLFISVQFYFVLKDTHLTV